jgi:hypothetical protein
MVEDRSIDMMAVPVWPFNASNFYTNPIGQSTIVYTYILGGFFYAIIMFLFVGYTLMKTESWPAASVVAIFIALIFSAVLPAIIIFIWAIACVFVFAAIVTQLVRG